MAKQIMFIAPFYVHVRDYLAGLLAAGRSLLTWLSACAAASYRSHNKSFYAYMHE